MTNALRASRFIGAGRDIRVSFEFFPPKTGEMEKTLWEAIARLGPLKPAFVSVTYGAGGSTRERTHSTVKRLLAETELVPAAHLTCVDATRAEIDGVIESYVSAGWTLSLPAESYSAQPKTSAYAPHWGPGFPHQPSPMTSPREALKLSPAGDRATLDLARAALVAEGLGQDEVGD